ncbi:MAG: galactose-1-epimerase [Defluviitaleaceae bacterium]|nr:galactose-1-epimerase [Defluviitaleaceae bacterium]
MKFEEGSAGDRFRFGAIRVREFYMREFFSLDGAFNKYAGFVADMVILSFLWIFFSIPFVTIGASTTALFYVATRRLANREGYISTDFWHAFKANFFRATLLWLIVFGIIFMIVWNMLLLPDVIEEMGALGSIILPAQVIILIEVLFIATWLFPVTARFDMGFKETLKSSFFLANRHMLTSFLCLLTLVALGVLSLFWLPLLLFIPGIYAMAASYLIMKVFKKHRPEMDKDPMLELREFERQRDEERRLASLGILKEETEMIYELRNKNGMKMTVTPLGCAIISLEVSGVDVALGLDSAEDYGKKHPFFGVAVGRFANRIDSGKFTLNGVAYELEKNENGIHHLHGGSNGFDKTCWSVGEVDGGRIVFLHESPDGDSGYPGNLRAKITYTLTDANVLRIDYEAETDTTTICNLTNHSYFNLEGFDAKDVYAHEVEICSDKITAVNDVLIPTGDFIDVTGTPFDFRTAQTIGARITAAGDVNNTGGYDHNYVLRGEGKAASVFAPKTGIRMTVSTNSPGMQLYTGNFLDGTVTGKGVTYQKHSGFCLETQLFPDGINHPNFPSCIVKKGEVQKFYTEFKFDW